MFFVSSSTRRGQSLIEVLIAVALGVALLTISLGAIVVSLKVSSTAENTQTASSLGKELLDNISAFSEGDWGDLLGNVATGSASHYYLNTARSPFGLISGDETLIVASTSNSSDPTLVAGYSLDEGSSSIARDSSANYGISTLVNGPEWVNGKHNKALSFDGNNDYVDLGGSATLSLTGSMTLSAWVYETANVADDGQIIAKSDGSSGWQFKSSPDTGPRTFGITINPSGGGSNVQRYSSTVRLLNTWYYVAGVYNSVARTLDIYVNGVLNNGVLSGVVPSGISTSNESAYIGQRGGGLNIKGIVDDVRVYNRALSSAEILSDMNTAVPAVTSSSISTLTRYFYLDDVYRDTNGFISATGTVYDPSTKKVTVVYNTINSTATNSLQTYLIRPKVDNVYLQTDWSGGSGQCAATSTMNSLFCAGVNVDGVTAPGSLSLTSTGATGTLTSAPFDTNFPIAGLVGAYGFSEGSGATTTDSSVYANNGTLSLPTWTSGKHGGGLLFNGVADYIELGNPAIFQMTSSITVSAWVYEIAEPPAGNGYIIAKSDDGTTNKFFPWNVPGGWELDSSDGQYRFAVTDPDISIYSHTRRTSNTVRALNTWYYVAGVFNAPSSLVDIYVNGTLDDGTIWNNYQGRPPDTMPTQQYNSANNVNIGRRVSAYSSGAGVEYIRGKIDDVRIYNRALTQPEIQVDMNRAVDAGIALHSIVWLGSAPAGTSVKFQLATSNSPGGPWNFKGPDGTSNTFYTGPPNASIPVSYIFHNNQRYFQYLITLVPSGGQSPRVDDVIVNWSP